MSEQPVNYVTTSEPKRAILPTELYTLQAHLPELERLLTSLLVTVQRAQGKEPSVMTRTERRR
jgi:hypothetical protein